MRSLWKSMRPCSSPVCGWPSVRPYGALSSSAACARKSVVSLDRGFSVSSSDGVEPDSSIAAAASAAGEGAGPSVPFEVGVASPGLLLRQCQLLVEHARTGPDQTNGGSDGVGGWRDGMGSTNLESPVLGVGEGAIVFAAVVAWVLLLGRDSAAACWLRKREARQENPRRNGGEGQAPACQGKAVFLKVYKYSRKPGMCREP